MDWRLYGIFKMFCAIFCFLMYCVYTCYCVIIFKINFHHIVHAKSLYNMQKVLTHKVFQTADNFKEMLKTKQSTEYKFYYIYWVVHKLPQITQPSQYKYTKLRYRFAVISGSPSIYQIKLPRVRAKAINWAPVDSIRPLLIEISKITV